MLVMGNPPARGGGGIPQRIMISSRSAPALQTTGAGQSGKTPGIGGKLPTYRFITRNSFAIRIGGTWRETASFPIDLAERPSHSARLIHFWRVLFGPGHWNLS